MQYFAHLLLVVLWTAQTTEACEVWRQKAKEAAEGWSGHFVQSNHGMVLVPALRNKRNADVKEEQHQVKYKRLSHSVHVQTDIRYRSVSTFFLLRLTFNEIYVYRLKNELSKIIACKYVVKVF